MNNFKTRLSRFIFKRKYTVLNSQRDIKFILILHEKNSFAEVLLKI